MDDSICIHCPSLIINKQGHWLNIKAFRLTFLTNAYRMQEKVELCSYIIQPLIRTSFPFLTHYFGATTDEAERALPDCIDCNCSELGHSNVQLTYRHLPATQNDQNRYNTYTDYACWPAEYISKCIALIWNFVRPANALFEEKHLFFVL